MTTLTYDQLNDMDQYITQEQALAVLGTLTYSEAILCSPEYLQAICNAAIQSYIDSLPKSEPVAYGLWVEYAGELILQFPTHDTYAACEADWKMYSQHVRHAIRPLYTSPQPALSKADMVKVLEALKNARSIITEMEISMHYQSAKGDDVDEAIAIMQSAIERTK